ncbi:hypothetical protein, partial [Ruminobacter amylophilus]|uniref:hypothetical protein n=1 Tax=Ruminobacter amylophilus TaxID=867 RepID=UPI003869B2D1
PEEGLEPSRYHYRRILNPLRLPIPPFWQMTVVMIHYFFICASFIIKLDEFADKTVKDSI